MSKTYIGFQAHGFGFEAHLTMTYLGEMTEKEEDNVWEILSTLTKQSYQVDRHLIQLFGPEKDIPVVTVNVGVDLMNLKRTLDLLIPDKSNYSWNPHITLDTSIGDIVIPQNIILTKLDLY